ncbi:MAG TPA: methionine biosynthesis protein MetW, partial [Burkholderiales bacterium]|nr:methionine biosynthesis protein MetW [Burkholderiales bacterium]
KAVRHDYETIGERIAEGSKVLDLGCGDGSLLAYLSKNRSVKGYGVEIDDANILACIRNSVNVIQSDLESGLSGFESGSFDYVILSQTLQAMKNTESIVREMLRVGREGIVTFPNFGYWQNRLQILKGRMPVSRNLPYEWFDSPNIRLCTTRDFEDFCSRHGVNILERIVMNNGNTVSFLPNLLGTLAVFRFAKGA